MLTREHIFQTNDLPTETVAVPEWGGEGAAVHVRTMSGTDRDAFEQEIIEARKEGAELVNIRARLAVKTVCDASGNRLFIDDDAEALGKKSGMVLNRIFDVAQRLNGIGPKDVEELEGN